MKALYPLLVATALVPSLGFGQTIVDDSWADGGRNNGADPLDADWWTSSASDGIEVSVGSLGLVSGSTGRGIHGTFTPQILGIGDILRATFTFTTPATLGAASSSPIRVALTDFNNAGLAANITASSGSPNSIYNNVAGYMVDYDFNTGATADVGIREHILASTSGRLLGTTAEWTAVNSSPDAGYSFAANTTYVGVMSVTRTGADSIDVFGSLSQGATLLSSHTWTDTSGTPGNFGLLAFWVNSNIFGSSNVPNTADNGIDFSNVTVELIPIPEPSGAALLGLGALVLGLRRRR